MEVEQHRLLEVGVVGEGAAAGQGGLDEWELANLREMRRQRDHAREGRACRLRNRRLPRLRQASAIWFANHRQLGEAQENRCCPLLASYPKWPQILLKLDAQNLRNNEPSLPDRPECPIYAGSTTQIRSPASTGWVLDTAKRRTTPSMLAVIVASIFMASIVATG